METIFTSFIVQSKPLTIVLFYKSPSLFNFCMRAFQKIWLLFHSFWNAFIQKFTHKQRRGSKCHTMHLKVPHKLPQTMLVTDLINGLIMVHYRNILRVYLVRCYICAGLTWEISVKGKSSELHLAKHIPIFTVLVKICNTNRQFSYVIENTYCNNGFPYAYLDIRLLAHISII